MQSNYPLPGNTSALSGVQEDFIEFARNNPEALSASNYRLLELKDKLFVLQPWPTFINQTRKNEFREASVKLFDLIKKIPLQVFNHDTEKMSAFYEVPESLIKLQLQGINPEHVNNLLARGDFVLTPAGLKCMEYNVTASLGGWYIPIWESLYLNTPIISKFLEKYRVDIFNENLIESLLQHILQYIAAKKAEISEEMNTVFVFRNYLEDISDPMGKYLTNLYKKLLQSQYLPLRGEVFMCDYHHLEIRGGFVYYRGRKIQALVEMYNGVVSPKVMNVFKAGNIRLLNGPISSLLSSKLNLALLSDCQYNRVFSDEERTVIARFVPWSRKIVPGNTTYSGDPVKLEDFITTNKDRLVIKPSIGYGGEGVSIGKRTPQREWEVLVNTALQQKNWLVQEYVEGMPGWYQVGDKGCELHEMVWGFFVLGAQYAGAWVRVLPQEDNKGIINCHQGAKVSIVFEVEE
jgi:hypothetical protein